MQSRLRQLDRPPAAERIRIGFQAGSTDHCDQQLAARLSRR
jgi:hypothetical protein